MPVNLFVFSIVLLVRLLASSWLPTLPTTSPSSLPLATPTPVFTLTPSPSPTLTSTPSPLPTPTRTPAPTPIASPTPVVLSGPPGAGLSTVTVATPVGNFRATILSLDMTSTRMFTDSAQDNDCANGCSTLPLKDYLTRNNGFAAVNGTYFCPESYPDCASKTNSFDFPIYNSRLNKWMQSDKLGWSNRRAIFYQDGSGVHYQHSSAGFGGGLTAGIINYPGLVNDGHVQIDTNQSGLSEKQSTRGTKIGIGTRNSTNTLVVIAYNVNLFEFAHVFASLGATGALNLDTGGSAALYYNGRFVIGPGRNLPNAIIFVRK